MRLDTSRSLFRRRIPSSPKGRLRHMAAPATLGLAVYFFTPTVVAFQDMSSLIRGSEAGAPRWAEYMVQTPAGSVHKAETPFVDPSLVTGSIRSAGVDVPGVGRIAFTGGSERREKLGIADPNPDENRVNRAEKGSRLVSVLRKAPPRSFNAGSLLEHSSLLLTPAEEPEVRMAFAPSKIRGEVEIALAFHKAEPPKAKPEMPVQLAKLITNSNPDILATGYASTGLDYAKASPFESILTEKSAGRFTPPVSSEDHDWAKAPLPPEVFTAKEQKCLAEAVYFEARGEPVKGQAAVAQVVLNRVRNPAFPKSICGVVYQNDDWRNRCQFSFACDGRRQRVTEPEHWKIAQQVAKAVSAGQIWLPEVGSATHYHATYVKPRWASAMERVKKIGLHIFYRTYGGGWS